MLILWEFYLSFEAADKILNHAAMSGMQYVPPRGEASAIPFLPDYQSFDASTRGVRKSYSRRLQANDFSKSDTRKIKAKRWVESDDLAVHAYRQQIHSTQTDRNIPETVSGTGTAIIYEDPTISFADIKPLITSYSNTLIEAYIQVSEAEGTIHERDLRILVLKFETQLKELIAEQQRHTDKVRARVEKMLEKHEGTRQILNHLKALQRNARSYKDRKAAIEEAIFEAESKLWEASKEGIAVQKTNLKERAAKIMKSYTNLCAQTAELADVLPTLREELSGLKIKEISLDERLECVKSEIEEVKSEIKVENEMSKCAPEIPEETRNAVRQVIQELHPLANYFSSLAAGLEYTLRCTICKTRIVEPRQVWPCGHVYCFECLKANSGNRSTTTSFKAFLNQIEKRREVLEKTLRDFAANHSDIPLGHISYLEMEIGFRRVDILLSRKQMDIVWEMIDPTRQGHASVGSVMGLLTTGSAIKSSALNAILHVQKADQPSFRMSRHMTMIAAKAKFTAASKIMEKALTFCPLCEVIPGQKPEQKHDPLTTKILSRLGFYESMSGQDDKVDILGLTHIFASSLSDIQGMVR